MIGQTLPHYRVLESMGVVYRALDVKLKREVALKILPSDLVRDEERKSPFIHEDQPPADACQ